MWKTRCVKDFTFLIVPEVSFIVPFVNVKLFYSKIKEDVDQKPFDKRDVSW